MDDEPGGERDRAIRAQVVPPPRYVEQMAALGDDRHLCDFMRETDTSPIGLVTRRYPQICVNCQRNWEIDDAMEPGALAADDEIEDALAWIAAHPAIHEVLITGGDPLAMGDTDIERILAGVARIPTVERIRIGSRIFVTMPMRMTDSLAGILAKYHQPGKRQVAVVTHVQHPYELTPDTALAVSKVAVHGTRVFNQLVYTFFVSRRFEATHLRGNWRWPGSSLITHSTQKEKARQSVTAFPWPVSCRNRKKKRVSYRVWSAPMKRFTTCRAWVNTTFARGSIAI